MKKQQVFPPSQAPSQWSRWVTHLYGTSTAPHTCAAHTRTHTHTHTHVHTHTHTHTHTRGTQARWVCISHAHEEGMLCTGYIYICRTGPGPRGASHRPNNVCSSSMYFFNVMIHLQTARGTCMLRRAFRVEFGEY